MRRALTTAAITGGLVLAPAAAALAVPGDAECSGGTTPVADPANPGDPLAYVCVLPGAVDGTPVVVDASNGQVTVTVSTDGVQGDAQTAGVESSSAAASDASLPFTGVELTGLAAVAVLAIGGGTALLVVSRRRARATA